MPVAMSIPNLVAYVVLNPTLAPLGNNSSFHGMLAFYIHLRFNCSLFTLTCSLEKIVGYFESFQDVHSSADFIIILFSGRKVPLTMEHAIHEIITPVVDWSGTIA